MKLSVKGLGLTMGLLWGVGLCLMTLVATYSGYMAPQLELLLVGVYPWYDVSLVGAFIGLGEGFVDGLIGGVVFAWVYNYLCCCCGKCCTKK